MAHFGYWYKYFEWSQTGVQLLKKCPTKRPSNFEQQDSGNCYLSSSSESPVRQSNLFVYQSNLMPVCTLSSSYATDLELGGWYTMRIPRRFDPPSEPLSYLSRAMGEK